MKTSNPLRVLLLLIMVLSVFRTEALHGQGRGGDQFCVVVGITQFNADTYDVKLKNLRTGYVHSVTVYIDIFINLNLQIGDRVKERREGGRTILVRDEGRQEPNPNLHPGPKPPDPELSRREDPLRGYRIYPVESLQVVNSFSEPKDSPPSPSYILPGSWDVLASGSFTAGGREPVVPIVRNGRLDTEGNGKSLLPEDAKNYNGQITTDYRGGVAVLENGTVVVGRQQGRTLRDIHRAFGQQVRDFMGGGALIIQKGREVSTDDLFHNQAFVDLHERTKLVIPGRTGLNAGQFRATNHTLVGTKGGRTFLIISPAKGGAQLQKDLMNAGFQDVVMFDGGNGFYFTDGKTHLGRSSNNSLGLRVRTRQQ